MTYKCVGKLSKVNLHLVNALLLALLALLSPISLMPLAVVSAAAM